MIVALASPSIATTLDEGLEKTKRLLSEASAQGAEIVYFPEAYLPGLRGQDLKTRELRRSPSRPRPSGAPARRAPSRWRRWPFRQSPVP